MLKAVQHKKTKIAYKDKEDGLTSSVFQLLLYLSSAEFWQILRDSIYHHEDLPIEIGNLVQVDFWPHWDATHTDNKNYVEPDVLLSFEKLDIIIEAKRWDSHQQLQSQWEKQIQAYINENGADKNVILVALGGIRGNKIKTILNSRVQKTFKVYKSRWAQLLNSIRVC